MNSSSGQGKAVGPIAPVPGELVFRRDQKKRCESLIVAVHGMGDQVRNDFAQNIAELFAKHYVKTTGVTNQVTRLPLGYWSSASLDSTGDDAIGFVAKDQEAWLNKFAFTEVHWAHIPRSVDAQGFRVEESKKWAASVVQRLCQRHNLAQDFGEIGPQVAATVVSEIAETLRIVDRLLLVAQKAGIADINTAEMLNKYLGDVQQVADFHSQRVIIRKQFLTRMQEAAEKCPKAEIHIVAHSEGTVVAFMSLLHALREESQKEMPDLNFDWINRVRSFSTLGSPIDKHLILWPEMWFRYSKTPITWRTLNQPIRWRNYYDLADPVGYELDTVRLQLEAWNLKAFDFNKSHDHGFRRYPLPGKAHIDYFADTDLFSTLIEEAIEPVAHPAKPKSTNLGRLSVPAPFLIVGGVFAAAVFILHKALNRLPESMSVPIENLKWPSPCLGIWGVAGCAALLYGTTVLARVFRISRDSGARMKASLVYLLSAAIYWFWSGVYSAEAGNRLGHLLSGIQYKDLHLIKGRIIFIALSVCIVAVSHLVDKRSAKRGKPPVWGLRWMILFGGGILASLLVIPRLKDSFSSGHPMTLILSTAAFLYLWWLGTLLFDLAFVWKTYINTTTTLFKKLSRKLKTPLVTE